MKRALKRDLRWIIEASRTVTASEEGYILEFPVVLAGLGSHGGDLAVRANTPDVQLDASCRDCGDRQVPSSFCDPVRARFGELQSRLLTSTRAQLATVRALLARRLEASNAASAPVDADPWSGVEGSQRRRASRRKSGSKAVGYQERSECTQASLRTSPERGE